MKAPTIQPFRVPDSVFVNMHNDDDYVSIPLKNLDASEVEKLCKEFVLAICTSAGVNRHTIAKFGSDVDFHPPVVTDILRINPTEEDLDL